MSLGGSEMRRLTQGLKAVLKEFLNVEIEAENLKEPGLNLPLCRGFTAMPAKGRAPRNVPQVRSFIDPTQGNPGVMAANSGMLTTDIAIVDVVLHVEYHIPRPPRHPDDDDADETLFTHVAAYHDCIQRAVTKNLAQYFYEEPLVANVFVRSWDAANVRTTAGSTGVLGEGHTLIETKVQVYQFTTPD